MAVPCVRRPRYVKPTGTCTRAYIERVAVAQHNRRLYDRGDLDAALGEYLRELVHRGDCDAVGVELGFFNEYLPTVGGGRQGDKP